jgi:hypothetical protein
MKWSEQFIYDNKLDGFFDYYIGTNNNYLYAKFSNLSLNFNSSNNKIKLIVFDKNTMTKVSETKLLGYGKDKDKKDMTYYKSIILDNVIYVLWQKEKKGVMELFAESINSKLQRINSLKKIYEVNIGKKATDNFAVMYNKEVNNKILLIKEFAPTKEDESLKIEYKLINEDFTLANSNQVTLPIIITKKKRRDKSTGDLICSYEFGDDGNLYIHDMIKIEGDDKKKLKKGEASVYPMIMKVDLESAEVKSFNLKFNKKNTFNFSTLITKNGVKLYGFFSDLDKDTKGNDTHGTFLITLDNKDFDLQGSKFSYFDKNFLDQLYAADKENQKKGSGLFKSKKAKESDDESISDNYVIENVIEDGKDILLFCSIMNNWSEQVCTTTNGRTSCYTNYYCTKSNVTTFKLNAAGDILWARNLDRSITYNRWNVYDLTVVKSNGNYFVVYGSAYQMNSAKKNRRNKKSNKQMSDRLEYAVFQGKTGDFKKMEYQVNSLSTKSNKAKYVNASNISLFDNKMYTSCSRTKFKPSTWFACLCPPVFYYLSYSGNSRKGTGYLGTISTLN